MDEKAFEKIAEKFCDRFCKYPSICLNQTELERICEKCPMNELEKMLED